MLINIHSHSISTNAPEDFVLPNCIVSKDYLYEQACSAGIHPWYIDLDEEAQWAALEQYAGKPQVLAIGECGLDKLTSTEWNKQIRVFEKQITLANALKKPLIIHCVRAYHEVFISLLRKEVKVPVIFHGFDRNWPLAEQLLKNKNYYLSLGTAILKGKLDDVIQHIPLDRFFLETDDKPTKISDIYAYFCRVRKLSTIQVEDQISTNFNSVFKST
ncbi:TatD family deoxyribonuclease [Sphingobacterium sp. DK4209]|uniref:TatD family deoxyribonuclease n=1 Tax=Sphingobacterium zhuxiongii TaxID=2662364 RepID=A0A5Q0Q838_9SPHI|nr:MULTISPECIES: TatD family hydrolase [unclassified Sphingobacterium]MVZ66850.1 TatD family deoxyribonuclease [Sphingobacterium sp. DK4209]QGA26227.1 TatD family deoxyribonuclease [Sphingobacterium sp. dk4302]